MPPVHVAVNSVIVDKFESDVGVSDIKGKIE